MSSASVFQFQVFRTELLIPPVLHMINHRPSGPIAQKPAAQQQPKPKRSRHTIFRAMISLVLLFSLATISHAVNGRWNLPQISYYTNFLTGDPNDKHSTAICNLPEPHDISSYSIPDFIAYIGHTCESTCQRMHLSTIQCGILLAERMNITRNREPFNYIPSLVARDVSNTAMPASFADWLFTYPKGNRGRELDDLLWADYLPSPKTTEEENHPMLIFEHPRQNQMIVYDDILYGKPKTPGILPIDIPIRLRLYLKQSIFSFFNVQLCFGFDPKSGHDQWGNQTRNEHGKVSCSSLERYKNYVEDGVGFMFYTETRNNLTVSGRRQFKAWIQYEEDVNDDGIQNENCHELDQCNPTYNENDVHITVLPGSMSEVQFVVSDESHFNRIQCNHRNRHFTTMTDLMPNELLELLHSIGQTTQAHNEGDDENKWTKDTRTKCRFHGGIDFPSYSQENLFIRSVVSSVCAFTVKRDGPNVLFVNVQEDLFEQRCIGGRLLLLSNFISSSNDTTNTLCNR